MASESSYRLSVLRSGWCTSDANGTLSAGCTISLLTGPKTILIETGNPWESEKLKHLLNEKGVSLDDVQYVICTHEHVDHIGNLNLFPNAELIVGTSIMRHRTRVEHDFSNYISYYIDDDASCSFFAYLIIIDIYPLGQGHPYSRSYAP